MVRSLLAVAWCAAALAVPRAVLSAPLPITLEVDATDVAHKVFDVRERLPATAGPMTFHLPRWLPGTHSPSGQVLRLAGLQVSADGQTLAWRRDTVDMHAFHVDVPRGATTLELRFQHLSPTEPSHGRMVMTPQMLNLQWNTVVLAPAGRRSDDVTVQPSLRLPAGWQAATALRPAAGEAVTDGQIQRYAAVTLERLVDSPVFAGRHLRRIPLEPEGAARPVVLNLVADTPELLAAPTEAQIDAHRRLVQQADRLFGARHFGHYDFLLALSERQSRIGLEHLESSENGTDTKYFEGWDKGTGSRALLPHEYTHSWNGKFRRPADLTTPDFQQPMRTSLLWVYEGQTEFWGQVLAARSGLITADQFRDSLADLVARQQRRPGRQWRDLQDVTNDTVIAYSASRDEREWPDWQRGRGEYYGEGLLIWLEADMAIRERSSGQRSLDDFARAFFGVADGAPGPLTYTFDDLVATLNRVERRDWAALLRAHLDSHDAAPLAGLGAAGWRLAWRETPTEHQRAREQRWRSTDLTHSLGLSVGAEGKLGEVAWRGPAFEAGLAPGMVLVGVNMLAYTPERLKQAVVANKGGQAPIELLLRDGDQFRQARLDWRGGLRYPVLEPVPDREDRLARLLAPR